MICGRAVLPDAVTQGQQRILAPGRLRQQTRSKTQLTNQVSNQAPKRPLHEYRNGSLE